MSERVTMTKLMDRIPDEASAYKYMEQLRWNGVPMCPHCHSTEVTFLNPENGTSRKLAWINREGGPLASAT